MSSYEYILNFRSSSCLISFTLFIVTTFLQASSIVIFNLSISSFSVLYDTKSLFSYIDVFLCFLNQDLGSLMYLPFDFVLRYSGLEYDLLKSIYCFFSYEILILKNKMRIFHLLPILFFYPQLLLFCIVFSIFYIFPFHLFVFYLCCHIPISCLFVLVLILSHFPPNHLQI